MRQGPEKVVVVLRLSLAVLRHSSTRAQRERDVAHMPVVAPEFLQLDRLDMAVGEGHVNAAGQGLAGGDMVSDGRGIPLSVLKRLPSRPAAATMGSLSE